MCEENLRTAMFPFKASMLFLFLAYKTKDVCNLTLSCSLFIEFSKSGILGDPNFPNYAALSDEKRFMLKIEDDPLRNEILSHIEWALPVKPKVDGELAGQVQYGYTVLDRFLLSLISEVIHRAKCDECEKCSECERQKVRKQYMECEGCKKCSRCRECKQYKEYEKCKKCERFEKYKADMEHRYCKECDMCKECKRQLTEDMLQKNEWAYCNIYSPYLEFCYANGGPFPIVDNDAPDDINWASLDKWNRLTKKYPKLPHKRRLGLS